MKILPTPTDIAGVGIMTLPVARLYRPTCYGMLSGVAIWSQQYRGTQSPHKTQNVKWTNIAQQEQLKLWNTVKLLWFLRGPTWPQL